MAAPYPIRPIAHDESPAFYEVLGHAFNSTYPMDPELQHDLGVLEFERSLAAFDGTEMVGTAIAFTLENLTIRRGEGVLSAPDGSVTAPRLRIVDPQRARAEMARVYGSVQAERPGMPARDDRWWEHILWDPEHRRSGGGPLRGLIAADDTGPRGYALYSAHGDWGEDGLPYGRLQVRELMATDAAAYAAIWNDLLSRDLIGEVRARKRPVDEPLLNLLADPRRARPKLSDGMWVRLVSVPEALTHRRYACAVDVVIEVADDVIAGNTGRWRLRAPGAAAGGDPGPHEPASCERTSAPAGVTLPVRALSAAYLGGTRLGALAAAGLVHEARPGAVAALSTAMSWEPAPWCPTGY